MNDDAPLFSKIHPQLTPWWKRIWHWIVGARMSSDNIYNQLLDNLELSSKTIYNDGTTKSTRTHKSN